MTSEPLDTATKPLDWDALGKQMKNYKPWSSDDPENPDYIGGLEEGEDEQEDSGGAA